jgi:hypothetical protein
MQLWWRCAVAMNPTIGSVRWVGFSSNPFNTFSALPSATNPSGTRGDTQKLWAVYLQ